MQGSQLAKRQAAHVAGEVENRLELGDLSGIQRWQLRDEVARQTVNHQLFAGDLGRQNQCVGRCLCLDLSRQLTAEVLNQICELFGRGRGYRADGIQQHALRCRRRCLGVGHHRNGVRPGFGAGSLRRGQQSSGLEHGQPAIATAIRVGDGLHRRGHQAADRSELGRVGNQYAQGLADQTVNNARARLLYSRDRAAQGRDGTCQQVRGHSATAAGSRSSALNQRINLLLRRKNGQPHLCHVAGPVIHRSDRIEVAQINGRVQAQHRFQLSLGERRVERQDQAQWRDHGDRWVATGHQQADGVASFCVDAARQHNDPAVRCQRDAI